MHSRLLLLAVVGGCLISLSCLRADDAAPPFELAKQYSADMLMTSGEGKTITSKFYTDSGKIRTEINTGGMQVVSIIRPDQQKMYSVMVAQKMVMEMPYDPEKMKKQVAAASGPEGKFELVGPDPVDGVACTKYKVTGPDGKVVFYWINAAQKTPVKMAAEDGTFNIVWKNYQVGPQDAALFEPPADYQKIAMPSLPSAPATPPGATPGGTSGGG